MNNVKMSVEIKHALNKYLPEIIKLFIVHASVFSFVLFPYLYSFLMIATTFISIKI